VYEVDGNQLFTIQSISKVFCADLRLRIMDAIVLTVGVEPTGDAFNAIILDELIKTTL